MALIKDGLWKLVEGTETAPDMHADDYYKFVGWRLVGCDCGVVY